MIGNDLLLGIGAVVTCVLCAISYFLGGRHQLDVCLRKRWETWMDDALWARACDIRRARWNAPQQRPRWRR